ncbi:MAG TPA: hypothetical protein V6D17_16490 [Candidatus Obscuribacterales bacterium]
MKQTHLEQMQKLLERGYNAAKRYAEARQSSIFAAFHNAGLIGEYWRAQILERLIAEAEECVSATIDKPHSLSMDHLNLYSSGDRLRQATEVVYWRSYALDNASLLTSKIEELRQRRLRVEGVETPAANLESSILEARVDSLNHSWRQEGVTDALLPELVKELNSRGMTVEALDGDITWLRAINRLTAAVEEYESLVEHYAEKVTALRQALDSNKQ